MLGMKASSLSATPNVFQHDGAAWLNFRIWKQVCTTHWCSVLMYNLSNAVRVSCSKRDGGSRFEALREERQLETYISYFWTYWVLFILITTRVCVNVTRCQSVIWDDVHERDEIMWIYSGIYECIIIIQTDSSEFPQENQLADSVYHTWCACGNSRINGDTSSSDNKWSQTNTSGLNGMMILKCKCTYDSYEITICDLQASSQRELCNSGAP